ncbi:MAG: hypothetical protein CMM08_04715 [Rhodospirillaceae bacterium]|nr:hypothetical protein [Rhodospirillaceae bacterium]
MDLADCFSATYAEARAKFLAAAAAAGAEQKSYPHPLTGPEGGELALDLAWFGPREASRVLVLSSATHGIEGFCGSGCQVGLLGNGLQDGLPPDTALLYVHAHNPHGFAHQRRVTEENVDLNRNFADFSQPLPQNPGYDEIHAWLVPADWDGPARAAADAAITGYIEERGMFAFQAAVSGGQYGHADGLFFGGHEKTWSRRTIETLAGEWLGQCRHLAVVDFHTGLGPRGHGELIWSDLPRGAGYDRARAWLGDEVKSPEGGDSVSAIVKGTIKTGYAQAVPDAEATIIAIEYGTVPPLDVLQALRADNWLHLHGELDSDLGRSIKRDIRAAFYGEDEEWNAMVWDRAQEVVGKVLQGLTGD